MSKEAKRLKIAGLVTMFAGLATLVWAIVCAVMGPDVIDALQGVAGAGGVVIGAQGARLANVPSSAEKIMMPAVIAFFVGAALFTVGYLMIDAPNYPQRLSICVIAILELLVALFAKSIVEMLKRK